MYKVIIRDLNTKEDLAIRASDNNNFLFTSIGDNIRIKTKVYKITHRSYEITDDDDWIQIIDVIEAI